MSINILLAFVFTLLILGCADKKETDVLDGRTNILLIVADDMGWTDLGCFGSEISTPNIDKIARHGIRFTDFHTSVSCSPTRSMLLSGTDNHLAGLGNMKELLTPEQKGKPGYEGHLTKQVASLPEVLKDGGYHTYMAGKWHLGNELGTIPGARGFERSFSLLFGGASHYSDRTGLQESTNPAEYSLDKQKINELPKDFYSSKNYTDFVIDAIRENKDDDQPFFAYLAFTAPHDPLHVPEPWLSMYKGKYDIGYEELRKSRIEKTKKLNLTPAGANVPRLHPDIKPWNSLTKEERAFESKKMEVYAGMVANLDYHVGRLINFLMDIGEFENTVIIFLSDNGPNPWYSTEYPGNADGVFLSQFDNRIENIGNPTSHISYAIGWASACAGPHDYFKMTVGEGGIRSPLIIAGPGIQENKINASFAYVTDLMPTILELTEVEHPDKYNGIDLHPMTGRAMKDILSGRTDFTYAPDEYIGGEMLNGKWMRKGDFKAVFVTKPYGPNEWKLYDLATDPGETRDLSEEMPDLLKELINEWDNYVKDVGVVLLE